MRNFKELMELSKIIRRAGQRVIYWYENNDFKTQKKSDSSPVTCADIESHEILVEALNRYLPSVPVFSEEDLGGDLDKMQAKWHEVRTLSEYWLLDPLDGTKGFVHKTGEFAINMALISGGQPVLGVMLVPLEGACYFAISGQAFKQDSPESEFHSIKARAFKKESPVFLVSSHHGAGETLIIRSQYPHADVFAVASAVKYGRIADGRADVSFRYSETAVWDLAAPDAILRAAGGGISDFEGKNLVYNGPSYINPGLCAFGDNSIPWWNYLKSPLTPPP